MRVLCVLLVVLCVNGESHPSHPYALLTEIKVLTLYKDRMTAGGRNAPIKQMACVDGDACRFFTPEVMNCVNMGTDDKGEVQWKCQAQMEDLYRLGQTQVSCEGYTSPDDPYILTGSCGVEYTLHLTKKGIGHHNGSRGPPGVQGPASVPLGQKGPEGFHDPMMSHTTTRQDQKLTKEDSFTLFLTHFFVLVTLGMCYAVPLLILCCCIAACKERPPHLHPQVHQADRPPPPPANYGNRPPVARAFVQQPPIIIQQQAPPPVVVHHHQSDSGPGFLTGYLLGGAGRRSDASYQQQHHHHHHTTYEAPRHTTHYSSSSSSDSGHSSPASSSSSSSSNTYTSTGFGGTKKR